MLPTYLTWESAAAQLPLLTPSEWKILLQVCEGLDSKTIAKNVNVMPKSVDNYRNRIGSKLGIKGYGKLSRFAVRHRHLLYDFEKKQFSKTALRWEKSQAMSCALSEAEHNLCP